MQSIKDKFGAVIDDACKDSSVPPEFLAALIANETGGNPNAKRFERGVLASLWEILQGRTAAFGSIGRTDVLKFIAPAPGDLQPPSDIWSFISGSITGAMQRLDSLATSWGLTQIMGYEGIPFGCETSVFTDPLSSLHYTLRMLAEFENRFQLDPTKDFDEMFRCWNSGRPHAATSDPQYSPNGLARMQIYKGLSAGGTDAGTQPPDAA
jgi:hypothetical protein